MRPFDQNSQNIIQVQTLFPNGLSTLALWCTQSNLTCIKKRRHADTKILSEDAQNRPHVTRNVSNIHNEFRSSNLTFHTILTA